MAQARSVRVVAATDRIARDYSPDRDSNSFGEATTRVKPQRAFSGLAVARTLVVRAILEVLLSLPSGPASGTRGSRRIWVLTKEWTAPTTKRRRCPACCVKEFPTLAAPAPVISIRARSSAGHAARGSASRGIWRARTASPSRRCRVGSSAGLTRCSSSTRAGERQPRGVHVWPRHHIVDRPSHLTRPTQHLISVRNGAVRLVHANRRASTVWMIVDRELVDR